MTHGNLRSILVGGCVVCAQHTQLCSETLGQTMHGIDPFSWGSLGRITATGPQHTLLPPPLPSPLLQLPGSWHQLRARSHEIPAWPQATDPGGELHLSAQQAGKWVELGSGLDSKRCWEDQRRPGLGGCLKLEPGCCRCQESQIRGHRNAGWLWGGDLHALSLPTPPGCLGVFNLVGLFHSPPNTIRLRTVPSFPCKETQDLPHLDLATQAK